MLHPQSGVIEPLLASDKPIQGPVPINNNFAPQPVQPPPRLEFPPIQQPPVIVHQNPPPPPIFAGIGKFQYFKPMQNVYAFF